MEQLDTLIQHCADKEFTQFGELFKDVMQKKIDEHPRMVTHKETVDNFKRQKEIYSNVELQNNQSEEG